MRNALRKLSDVLNFGMDKVIPDSIVLAMVLTLITFGMGIALTASGPFDMIKYWGNGFWGFLAFSMQMTLVITTGYIVANAPPAYRFLVRLCNIPKNGVQGVVFVAIGSTILSWIYWGLGAIAGAILARTVAVNLRKVDYKLYVAVAYACTMTVAMIGISSSEFLLVNTPGHFLEKMLGLIPMTETALEPSLLIATFVSFIVVIPWLAALLHTDSDKTPEMDAKILDRFLEQNKTAETMRASAKPKSEMNFAERVDNSPILNMIIGIGGLIWIGWYFGTRGFDLTLDVMNFVMMMLGILLHGTPRNLLAAAEEGVRTAFGVVVQFPFYAGIQGMMAASGLVALIANFFASISTVTTFPYFCYLAMVIINFFIPSSGGIFMVAGGAMGQAALNLGVAPNQFLISFTAGESIGNMIQPFWAIPLLGIAGLKMKDIMGYEIIFFVVSTVLFFATWAIMW